VPTVAFAPNIEAGVMKSLYAEHAGVLWDHAMQSTSEASRAEFTLARNIMNDERRGGRFRVAVSALDQSNMLEQCTLGGLGAIR
jgi:hypothetical protein